MKRGQGKAGMKDYGSDIPCPMCGHEHHITPKELQCYLQIPFVCTHCQADVLHENPIAEEIAYQVASMEWRLPKGKVSWIARRDLGDTVTVMAAY